MPETAPTQDDGVTQGFFATPIVINCPGHMAKSREKKQNEAASLADKFSRMKVVVLTTTGGLKVKDSNVLRTLLRKEGIDHVVAKKTLIRRALEQSGLKSIDLAPLTQSMAMSFGYDDEVAPARVLATFAKTHETLKFLGGIVEGSFTAPDTVKMLASLPAKPEMRGRFVGTIAAPLTGFARVLQANLTGFVRILRSLSEKPNSAPTS